MPENVVVSAISRDVGKTDLAPGLSNAGHHGHSVSPDTLALQRGNVLVVQEGIDRATVVDDEVVGVAIFVEVRKVNLIARLSKARWDGQRPALDTVTGRGLREIAVVEECLDGAATIDDKVVI